MSLVVRWAHVALPQEYTELELRLDCNGVQPERHYIKLMQF